MQFTSSLLALVGLGASVVAATECPVANVGALALTGEPVGKEIVQDNITTYITGCASETAVLYLTDVFGINLTENKLLADSFGRAGYLTVAPDLFFGEPAPEDLDQPGWNVTEFLEAHEPPVTDPLIESTIDYMRAELGVKTIVVAGYCFGGRYTYRFVAEGRGVSAGFAAHPSLATVEEISAMAGPVSVAAAETDDYMTPEWRHEVEALMQATGEAYSLALYGGTLHGFAVRPDLEDKKQVFGKTEAYFQAVRWFDSWA